MTRISGGATAGIFLSAVLVCSAGAPPAGALDSMRGKLVVDKGHPSLLRTAAGDIRLVGADPKIEAAFADPRITGREFELSGRFLEDGSFEIHEYWVVRGDSLRRLIYFCET